MTNREFKQLKREELIEIIYQLQLEAKKMVAANDALRLELEERKSKLKKAGSIAEAALTMNNVFQAAQAAADQYLEEIRTAALDIEKQRQCVLLDAQKEANEIVLKARQTADKIISDAHRECESIYKKNEEDCIIARQQVAALLSAHENLQAFISKAYSKEGE